MTDKIPYFQKNEKCWRCKDAEPRFRVPYGFVAVEGGSRWRHIIHLCPECHLNAKKADLENKQQPLWYFRADPKVDENGEIMRNAQGRIIYGPCYLEKSDKTIWPSAVKGRTYGAELPYPTGG